ncbi:hypothetical protein BGW80DRAFT_1464661 [Lactifluus volemus]|nr:hypothetical protein BGW80DRAFT_1464661 [Lactifluus volemus]
MFHLICPIVSKALRQFARLGFFLHPSWKPFSALEKHYLWTLKSLDDDDKQVRFFENIPGFCSFKVLRNPLEAFDTANAPEAKRQRLDICWEPMCVASLPITWPILGRVLYKEWPELLYSVEFGLFMSKAYYCDTKAEHHLKCVVATILAANWPLV